MRRRSGRNGQVTLEFSMMIALAFIFFAVVLIVILFYQKRITQQRLEEELHKNALAIQQELLIAATVKSGYERTFTLPDLIEHKSYTVTFSESTLTIMAEDEDDSYNIRVPPFTGNILPGSNRIRKVGDTIIIDHP